MCGRFVLKATAEQLQLAFDLATLPAVTENYNVAPTQMIPVITNEAPRDIVLYRWGLVPSWSKDLSMASKMINARSETVDEKPSFRSAFKRRRCLIPANGFYEWKTVMDGKKTPLYIQLTDAEVFAFGGLWEVWMSPTGEEVRTCTILTTAANDFMTTFHDRMPIIIARDAYSEWLAPGDQPASAMKPLLQQYASAKMTAYEVSKSVNKAGYSAPEMIEPVDMQRRLL
jgi:putative SOS response-associated peptidase YedK